MLDLALLDYAHPAGRMEYCVDIRLGKAKLDSRLCRPNMSVNIDENCFRIGFMT